MAIMPPILCLLRACESSAIETLRSVFPYRISYKLFVRSYKQLSLVVIHPAAPARVTQPLLRARLYVLSVDDNCRRSRVASALCPLLIGDINHPHVGFNALFREDVLYILYRARVVSARLVVEYVNGHHKLITI